MTGFHTLMTKAVGETPLCPVPVLEAFHPATAYLDFCHSLLAVVSLAHLLKHVAHFA